MKSIALAVALFAFASNAFAAEALKGEAKNFADKVTVSNKFEIDTSNLALEYGKSDDVKSFAKSMVADHTKAGEDFKAALAKANLTPPAETLDVTHTAKYAKLRVFTTEAGFDRAYVDAQVAAHEEAVALFKDYANKGETPALKDFAAKTLPTLEHHLAMVKGLSGKIKETK
jgi:putative membrane protein